VADRSAESSGKTATNAWGVMRSRQWWLAWVREITYDKHLIIAALRGSLQVVCCAFAAKAQTLSALGGVFRDRSVGGSAVAAAPGSA
jgi:hypothetical protein